MVSCQPQITHARFDRASRYVLALSILVMFMRPAAMGQAQHLMVTIATEKTNAAVTDAEISVNVGSNMYYIGGGQAPNWVAQPGLLVTDPVVPPQSFKLQAIQVDWAAFRQVEFPACRQNEQQNQQRPAKLTMADGESREVFLWYRSRGELTPLGPEDLKITGKMSVAGQVRGVEFQADWCKLLRLTVQVQSSPR